MNRFEQLFEETNFPLIVSLPANALDMAKAARDGGADAIKMHTAVPHFASGTQFGSLEEESSVFEAIRRALDVPLGLVPGVGVNLEMEEIERVADLGFDFWDAFITQMTPLIWQEPRLAPMLCLLPHHSIGQAEATALLPGVVCLEADIVEHEGYGQRLSVEDCVTYKLLAESITVPLVVPTQRAIRPNEIGFLADMGVGSVMIGAIVTGKTVEGVATVTRAFRDAIDQL
jgi:hypothetical protein